MWRHISLLLVAAIVTFGISCKKQEPQAGPSRFDPQVDGIAVRPLPAIDAALAKRILRDGPILPTADASPEGDAAIATVTPALPTITPKAEKEPEVTPSAPAPTAAPRTKERRPKSDPNS